MIEDRSETQTENFNDRLGEHLRHVRKQKGLSLLDVEAASRKEFKASVLGAYERGERAISAQRLARLADLYRLPAQALLPPDPSIQGPPERADGFAIDAVAAESSDAPEARVVLRYVRSLQAMRGAWSERVVAVRSEDVRALAAVLEVSPDGLVRRLEELGLRAWRPVPERREGELA